MAARAMSAPSTAGDEPRVDDASAHSRDTPVDELIGTVVADKFRIRALIGEGAMGRVYRARHVPLERDVAIKVLHRHLGGHDRVAQRFQREALAASRLSHPNSLHVIDFGTTADGTLYIAMELLDGEDLQTIIDHDYPLAPARIARILGQVLYAVDEAHHAGIIHRDLKPENIVVLSDRSGREHVKVCDFGIAKILDGEGPSITVDGFVCGTPQYMAPEQARGEDIDHRVDIYAAGCVLYQMLVGSVPYVGDNALGIITKHLTERAMPPRQRRPELGIPRSLEQIVQIAMSKRPEERYSTAAAMAEALERAVAELGPDADTRLGEGRYARDAETSAPTQSAEVPVVKASPPAPTQRPRWALPLAALAAVLAIGGAALWSSRGASAPVSEPPRTAPATVEPATPPLAPPQSPPVDPPAITEPIAPQAAEPPPRPRRTEPRPRSTAASEASPEAATDVDAPRSEGQRAFEEGRRRFLANDVPGAIASFEEAARAMPRSADVQKQLGRAYMRGGDVDRAIAAYERYLTLAPEAPDRAVVERIIAQH